MKSESRSPLYPPTLVLAVVGAALPLISLLKSGGVRGFLDGAGLLLVVWGLSPFLLFPIAARLARRGWVRRMVLTLVAVAVLFGLIGFLVLLPRRPGTAGTLLYLFLPIWQWPMALLGGALAVFVPSEEQERLMSGEGEG